MQGGAFSFVSETRDRRGISVSRPIIPREAVNKALAHLNKARALFDGSRTEWVPKSQVEENGDGTFAMPEWLAKEKGFI